MNAAEYLAEKTRAIADRAAQDVAKAEREAQALAALPPGVAFERISTIAHAADVTLTLMPVREIAGAGELMRLLPPVAMVRVKDGSLSFIPRLYLAIKPHDRAEIDPIAPFIIEHKVAPFYPPTGETREVRWYTLLGDLVAAVHLPLDNPESTIVRIECSGFGPTRKHRRTAASCQERASYHDRYWMPERTEEAHVVFWWYEGAETIDRLDWGTS